jgi:periplasmic protein TonB
MFEKTFIASQRGVNVKRTLVTLPLAVLAHAAALGAVTLGQIWAVAELSEPPLQVSFYQAAPPSPPPPPPPVQQKQKVVQPVAQQQVVQPVVVPEKLPEASTSNENDGVDGGVDGGGKNGVVDSLGTGQNWGPGVLSDKQPDDVPIRIGGEVVPPEPISRPQPLYPDIARKAHVTGVAIVEAIIDKQGNVTDARVLRGLPMGLSEAATNAILRWKYRPATLNGRPVVVYLTVTVNFTLQ